MKGLHVSELAINGGTAVFPNPIREHDFWPPVDDGTADRLVEVYRSRDWTAFGVDEPRFAQAFADHHDAAFGVFTVNGTVTLHAALAALNVGPGDEVIVGPFTWYATAIAVRHAGARPVFVDIKPDTLCIDPDKIEAAITSRTRAIIPVHAYGSMADMDRIMDIARRHDLSVIEDCAHMHGGAWAGQGVGSIGDVGSFSFQYTKTMTSGEGGISITNDPELYERMFRFKQVGYGPNDVPRQTKVGPPPDLLCYNLRATSFHPVILDAQLRGLDERLDRYNASVRYLEERLTAATPLRLQAREPRTTRQGIFGFMMIFDDPVYEGIPVTRIRDAIQAEGVTLRTVEGPLYDFILFNADKADYDIPSPCDVTELACARGLWLLHPYLGLDAQQVEGIADAIVKIAANPTALRD